MLPEAHLYEDVTLQPVRTPQAYELSSRSVKDHLVKLVVYDCVLDDYDAAREDTKTTGDEHISVTEDPSGGYPFFTCPKYLLKPVQHANA